MQIARWLQLHALAHDHIAKMSANVHRPSVFIKAMCSIYCVGALYALILSLHCTQMSNNVLSLGSQIVLTLCLMMGILRQAKVSGVRDTRGQFIRTYLCTCTYRVAYISARMCMSFCCYAASPRLLVTCESSSGVRAITLTCDLEA